MTNSRGSLGSRNTIHCLDEAAKAEGEIKRIEVFVGRYPKAVREFLAARRLAELTKQRNEWLADAIGFASHQTPVRAEGAKGKER